MENRKNTVRFSALALLVSLLTMTASLASCGENAGTDTPDDTNAASQTEAVTEAEPADMLEARKLIDEELPAKDFGGKSYRILTYDMSNVDFIAEAETGALVNDAVYRRNVAVEDRFNVKLQVESPATNADAALIVKKFVPADEDAYELISFHMIETAQLAINGMYQDWNDIPYFHAQKPWWSQNAYENLSIGGKVFLLSGAISHYSLGSYYCVYMNKRLGAEYDLTESIYDTVLDGKFTIDKYQSLVKGIYKDLNGNGEVDDQDQFGLAAQVTSYATTFAYAFGETAVSHDADGMPYLNMNLEKWSSMIDKVYQLFYETEDTITTTGWSLHSDTFKAGRALFMNGVFQHSYNRFTDVADDFAILPYPKWDEAQTDYLTMTDGSSPLLSVPVTCADTELAGIITEALAAGAYKTIIPTVYDVALKVRGARDETSVKIIDIIERGCVFDFGFVFSGNVGMGATVNTMMGAKNKDFASYYEKNHTAWEKKISNIVDQYNEQ